MEVTIGNKSIADLVFLIIDKTHQIHNGVSDSSFDMSNPTTIFKLKKDILMILSW